MILSIVSFLFCFASYGNEVSLYVKNDVYELQISKMESFSLSSVRVKDKYSLQMVSDAEEIIKYLYKDDKIESDVNLEDVYKILLKSSVEIDQIKDEVLTHFLKLTDMQIRFVETDQQKYKLSYLPEMDSRESHLISSENSSVQLHLDFKRRLITRGSDLNELCDHLNSSLNMELLEAGDSGVKKLPRMHFRKRKFQEDPIEYLKSKGFELEELNRKVGKPVIEERNSTHEK